MKPIIVEKIGLDKENSMELNMFHLRKIIWGVLVAIILFKSDKNALSLKWGGPLSLKSPLDFLFEADWKKKPGMFTRWPLGGVWVQQICSCYTTAHIYGRHEWSRINQKFEVYF